MLYYFYNLEHKSDKSQEGGSLTDSLYTVSRSLSMRIKFVYRQSESVNEDMPVKVAYIAFITPVGVCL